MGDPTPRVSIAGRYPVELEADILVRTGARLHLRPIRSDDATRLVTFHHNLSFDSIYRRYFSMHPELSPDEVAHLTEVDYVERMAFVVEDGEVLVAVGRYDRVPHSSTAEVAFVVRDDYQHLGLGHQLLEALADAAREGYHGLHRRNPARESRHDVSLSTLEVPGHVDNFGRSD